MKHYFFHNCTKKITIGFMDLFDDLSVKRFSGGEPVKTQNVPIRFGAREKLMDRLSVQDSEPEVTLPTLSTVFTGMEKREDDMAGKYEKLKLAITYEDSDQTIDDYYVSYSPTPYDFNFELDIWARKLSGMFQITENILALFNPKVSITLDILGLGLEHDFDVILNSANVSLDEITEVDAENIRELSDISLDFTVRGFLFKPIVSAKPIKKIQLKSLEFADVPKEDPQEGSGDFIITAEQNIENNITINEELDQLSL